MFPYVTKLPNEQLKPFWRESSVYIHKFTDEQISRREFTMLNLMIKQRAAIIKEELENFKGLKLTTLPEPMAEAHLINVTRHQEPINERQIIVLENPIPSLKIEIPSFNYQQLFNWKGVVTFQGLMETHIPTNERQIVVHREPISWRNIIADYKIPEEPRDTQLIDFFSSPTLEETKGFQLRDYLSFSTLEEMQNPNYTSVPREDIIPFTTMEPIIPPREEFAPIDSRMGDEELAIRARLKIKYSDAYETRYDDRSFLEEIETLVHESLQPLIEKQNNILLSQTDGYDGYDEDDDEDRGDQSTFSGLTPSTRIITPYEDKYDPEQQESFYSPLPLPNIQMMKPKTPEIRYVRKCQYESDCDIRGARFWRSLTKTNNPTQVPLLTALERFTGVEEGLLDTYLRSGTLIQFAPGDTLELHGSESPKKYTYVDKETLTLKQSRFFSFFREGLYKFVFNKVETPEARVFFEIIPGWLPQKPHFDIDVPFDQGNGEDLVDIGGRVVISLIERIYQSLEEKGIILSPERDILLYHSNGPKKCSFHVVINNYCHSDNHEAKAFYKDIVSRCEQDVPGKTKFIDHAVYSKLQQFRLFGAQKYGSGRSKVLVNPIPFRGRSVSHYTKDHQQIFKDSLVSNTLHCNPIPTYISEAKRRERSERTQRGIEELDFEEAIKLLNSRIPEGTFIPSISETAIGIIELKRNVPNSCPICEGKVHEHENSFITISSRGGVYYNCRRHPDNKSLYLGYMNFHEDENNSDDRWKETPQDEGTFGGDWGKDPTKTNELQEVPLLFSPPAPETPPPEEDPNRYVNPDGTVTTKFAHVMEMIHRTQALQQQELEERIQAAGGIPPEDPEEQREHVEYTPPRSDPSRPLEEFDGTIERFYDCFCVPQKKVYTSVLFHHYRDMCKKYGFSLNLPQITFTKKLKETYKLESALGAKHKTYLKGISIYEPKLSPLAAENTSKPEKLKSFRQRIEEVWSQAETPLLGPPQPDNEKLPEPITLGMSPDNNEEPSIPTTFETHVMENERRAKLFFEEISALIYGGAYSLTEETPDNNEEPPIVNEEPPVAVEKIQEERTTWSYSTEERLAPIETLITSSPDKFCLCVSANCGSGKTSTLIEYIRAQTSINPEMRILIVTFRKTMALKQQEDLEEFGFEMYTTFQDALMISNVPRLIVQIDSLYRVIGGYDMLILDEIKSITHHLVTFVKEKSLCSQALELYIRLTDKVYVADALLDNNDIAYIELLGRKPIVHINRYERHADKRATVISTKAILIHTVIEKIEEGMIDPVTNIWRKRRVVIPTGSKKFLLALAEQISRKSPELRIKTYSSSDDITGDVTKEWEDLDIVIYSPTLSAGNSFVLEYFDLCFCYFPQSSCPPGQALQMIFRSRKTLENGIFLCIENCGAKAILPPFIETVDQAKDAFENKDILSRTDLKTSFAAGYSNLPMSRVTGKIERNSPFFHIFSNVWMEVSRGKHYYKSVLFGYLKLMGVRLVNIIDLEDVSAKNLGLPNYPMWTNIQTFEEGKADETLVRMLIYDSRCRAILGEEYRTIMKDNILTTKEEIFNTHAEYREISSEINDRLSKEVCKAPAITQTQEDELLDRCKVSGGKLSPEDSNKLEKRLIIKAFPLETLTPKAYTFIKKNRKQGQDMALLDKAITGPSEEREQAINDVIARKAGGRGDLIDEYESTLHRVTHRSSIDEARRLIHSYNILVECGFDNAFLEESILLQPNWERVNSYIKFQDDSKQQDNNKDIRSLFAISKNTHHARDIFKIMIEESFGLKIYIPEIAKMQTQAIQLKKTWSRVERGGKGIYIPTFCEGIPLLPEEPSIQWAGFLINKINPEYKNVYGGQGKTLRLRVRPSIDDSVYENEVETPVF